MDNATNATNSTFEGWQAQQEPKSFWTNLTLPVLYLTILIGSLYTFSTLYRKRQIAKAAQLEGWFPRHKARDVYLSLLHINPEEASEGDGEKRLKQIPDSLLKAALLRRAVEDIQRIVQLRTSKQALQTLLQRGSVGDDLWQRFQRAEQEIEEEVKDVVNEANAFSQGWGQTIFQSANEINQNIMVKDRVDELQGQVDEEKEWWESKRADIQASLMKEIEAEKAGDEEEKKKSENGATVAPAASTTTTTREEDAVLVESGGPAGSLGSAKKSKGKK